MFLNVKCAACAKRLRHCCAQASAQPTKLRRCSLLAGLLWVLGAGAYAGATPERWAQLAVPTFQHLTKDDGLSGNTGTAIAQDGEGFLWIGSQGGLARWDGYRFRIYRPEPGQTGSLPDNNILSLHADRQGQLWVGTVSGGLARYERTTDQFHPYPVGPQGLSHVSVHGITDIDADRLAIATEGGLDILHKASGTVRQLHHIDADPGSLPSDRVNTALMDAQGHLLVGTAEGLARLDLSSMRFQTLALPAAGTEPVPVESLYLASDNRLWIGTRFRGAFVMAADGGQISPVLETSAERLNLASERISAIVEARPGQIWLGTFGQGIVSVDTVNQQTRRFSHDASRPTSLADNTLWGLFRDRSGLVWANTSRGLSRHEPSQNAVLTVFGDNRSAEGLTDTDVMSVLPMADGRIWLGLGNNGIDIIDPLTGRVAGLRPDPEQPERALPRSDVFSMVGPQDHKIYLGTFRGLYAVNTDLSGLQRRPLTPLPNTAGIAALHLDHGHLWLAGRDDGFWQLPTGPGGALGKPAATATLADPRLNCAEADGKGGWWLGTRNGLAHYDPALHKLASLPLDEASPLHHNIASLLLDRKQRLWVGTRGQGLYVVVGHEPDGRPRFRQLTVADGLPNANIDKLLADRKGDVWASTDDGIAVIDSKTLSVRALKRAEGVVISGYWVGSGAVSLDGELIFGGLGGFTVVRPERLGVWQYQPPIVATEIRIGGKRIASAHVGAHASDALLIRPEANSLAVEFAALDFSAPERNQYAYQLQGYDVDWITTDPSRRLASYTNLPPGEYQLRVRGSNRNARWSDEELAIPVRVLPAWYQTIWLRTLALLVLLAAVYGLVRLRTAYLHKQQQALEQKVREQKQLTNELQHLAKLKDQLLSNTSHELRTPLNGIIGLTECLLIDISERESPELHEQLKSILQSGRLLSDLVDDILDFQMLRADELTLNPEHFALRALVDECLQQSRSLMGGKPLSLHNKVGAELPLLYADRQRVKQVLKHLLSNAIKFSASGNITISARVQSGQMHISVSDQGPGIPADLLQHIFAYFEQLDGSSTRRQGGIGLGLALAKILVESHQGQLRASSTVGVGSCFEFSLPMPKTVAT